MAIQRMDHVSVVVDDLAASCSPSMTSRASSRTHGAELVGEVGQYEDSYRLCYVRGPAGIIVALAEQLS
jgi:hypothetical protein